MKSSARKRIKNNKNYDEPHAKLRKTNMRQIKNKNCYIFILPDEMLHKIFSYIAYWHFRRIRMTCKRFRNACDSFILHTFESSILFYNQNLPNDLMCAALTAVKAATWPYVSYGLSSIFCGTLLRIVEEHNQRMIIDPKKIKSFLKAFYTLANSKCGKPNSQVSRLLYCFTLMRLLKKFKNSHLLSSAFVLPNYWKLTLEIQGPWVGVLSSPKAAAEPHERAKLLMMLCEMMIANSTSQAFKKVWECDSEVFVFGNDASERTLMSKYPTTSFTFKINGPVKIAALLKSCLEDEEAQLPQNLPKGEFVVSVNLTCREAVKWGCCQVHQIEIGPHFDESFDDDQDESEDMDEDSGFDSIYVEIDL